MLPQYESLSHSVDLFRDYLLSSGPAATQRMIQQAEVQRSPSGSDEERKETAMKQTQESDIDSASDAGSALSRAGSGSVGRLRASKPHRVSNTSQASSVN